MQNDLCASIVTLTCFLSVAVPARGDGPSAMFPEPTQGEFQGSKGYYANRWVPILTFREAASACSNQASESLSFDDCMSVAGWRRKGTNPSGEEAAAICRLVIYLIEMVGPGGPGPLRDAFFADFNDSKRFDIYGLCLADKGFVAVHKSGAD